MLGRMRLRLSNLFRRAGESQDDAGKRISTELEEQYAAEAAKPEPNKPEPKQPTTAQPTEPSASEPVDSSRGES